MALNLPDPNREVGDSGHTSDTNLIIDAINTLKGEVDAIPQGPQGPQGEPGTPGAAGANASVNIGSTTTGAPGSSASVTNSGTEQNAVFNFTIPQGATGAAGAAGAQGPQGPKGDTGETGPVGPTGVVAANSPLTYDTLNRTINLDVDALQLDPDQVTGLDPTGQTGKFVGTLDGSGLDWITSTATTSWGSIAGTLSDQTDLQTALNNKAPSTGINPSAITGTAVVDSDARLTNERTPTDGSVTEAKIATGAVTEGKIGSSAVTEAKIGTGAVTETKIGTGAVTSDKIANGTIVDADISNTAAIAPSKINGTAVVDSDARLTDTRTPTDGTVTDAKITAGGLSPTSITGTAVVTNDSRLSDARTPLAHAASHGVGQSDAITVAQSQVTNLTTDLSAKAPLASPALSGTPTAPTAATGTDTTQVATTAFVNAEISNDAILKSIVDAKGDLIVGTASDTVSRLGVGTNGQALIADSGETAGVRWGTVATDPTPTALFLGGM